MNISQINMIIIIVAVFFTLYQVGTRIYKWQLNRMQKAIYENADYKQFTELSNQPLSRILISKTQRELMNIDARIITNHTQNIAEDFKKLHQEKLLPSQKAVLYRDEIMYLIENNQKGEAEDVYNEFKKEVKDCTDSQIIGILKEADYEVNVDMNCNVTYLGEMKRLAKTIDVPVSKGIFSLRTAKLYKKNGNISAAASYGKDAVVFLKGSAREAEAVTFLNSLEGKSI